MDAKNFDFSPSAIMLSGENQKPLFTMRKQTMQRHQKIAFLKTLDKIESDLQQRINFITDYDMVYKFPASIARTNLRHYKKKLKAIQQLKDI